MFVLQVGLFFLLGQNAGGQVVQSWPGRYDTDWPIWLVGAILVLGLLGWLLITL